MDTKTPCTVRIDKYRSNWELFVKSSEDYGDTFQGQLHEGLDGMEEEDREAKEDELKKLARCETVEEIEELMEAYGYKWNCIAQDHR